MSRLTGWRRVASAMWSAPNDPQIYGSLEIDASALLRTLQRAREAGHHVTATHVVGKALAVTLAAVPELNVRIHGGRAVPRPSVDIFFITSIAGGSDLSGVKLEGVDRLPISAIAEQLKSRAARLRTGGDREFARSKQLMNSLPHLPLKLALRVTALLTQRLQLDLPSLALRKSPFGSAMITSVGMFGIPQGFAPLSWMYDVPILLLVGELTEKPVVVDNQVAVRPILPLTATVDHRYVDGSHLSRAMKALKAYLADPEAHETG
jgi:pyruvate/2-oxoglutarate dehydrogenase complex dihydrolipoamide acyltransferase (E2) component